MIQLGTDPFCIIKLVFCIAAAVGFEPTKLCKVCKDLAARDILPIFAEKQARL